MFLICSYFPDWTLQSDKEECQTEYNKNTIFHFFQSFSFKQRTWAATGRCSTKKAVLQQWYSNWGYRGSFIFLYERYFKCKKHKQKHLSNIQPNISINKKSIIQTIYTKKNISRYVLKDLKKAGVKHLEQTLLVTS